MTDYFALLNEPRRPWLDPDSLKKKFVALSTTVHPDRVHTAGETETSSAQQRYTELNLAYSQLRDPKERLQHLIELESGVKPAQVQQIPAGLMEFFMEVGRVFRENDAFLSEKARTISPLLQVKLFERAQAWIDRLRSLQTQLNTWRGDLVSELKAIDALWIAREIGDSAQRTGLLTRLEDLYRRFSYYARWEAQTQERIIQLSL